MRDKSRPVWAVTGKDGEPYGARAMHSDFSCPHPQPSRKETQISAAWRRAFSCPRDIPRLFLNVLGQFSLNKRPACSPYQN